MKNYNTYFYDETGEEVGKLLDIVPIYPKMEIVLSGGEYEVLNSKLIITDTDTVLKVYCRKFTDPTATGTYH